MFLIESNSATRGAKLDLCLVLADASVLFSLVVMRSSRASDGTAGSVLSAA
jgi:hypothetical protein